MVCINYVGNIKLLWSSICSAVLSTSQTQTGLPTPNLSLAWISSELHKELELELCSNEAWKSSSSTGQAHWPLGVNDLASVQVMEMRGGVLGGRWIWRQRGAALPEENQSFILITVMVTSVRSKTSSGWQCPPRWRPGLAEAAMVQRQHSLAGSGLWIWITPSSMQWIWACWRHQVPTVLRAVVRSRRWKWDA